jgi:D-alanyl-lipoteichoic acid acyltransferase DltB (MBOAT superfamily)
MKVMEKTKNVEIYFFAGILIFFFCLLLLTWMIMLATTGRDIVVAEQSLILIFFISSSICSVLLAHSLFCSIELLKGKETEKKEESKINTGR